MNYPLGTTELYTHLGIDKPQETVEVSNEINHFDDSGEVIMAEPVMEHDEKTNTYTVNISTVVQKIPQVAKTAAPYVSVFLVAILAYLMLFTDFSLTSAFKSLSNKPPASSAADTSTIPQNQVAAYNAWINSYFFDVTDPKIVAPGTDLSGNGLTNYQKFLLGLNPKKKDTLGLGMTDTQALLAGINPLTGTALTDAQKKLVAENINLEAVSNRTTLAALEGQPKVAGANTDTRGGVVIDKNISAELNIPSLGIQAPLIWSKDVDSLIPDLQNGVVHYPGTAMPGEIGTAYISGHSSNFSWDKGKYNKVFAKLGDLKRYESFTITATDINGKRVVFHYVVTTSDIFMADDQRQFASIGKSTVGLSTCWPIGTTQKRLVVFAELTQVDK